ncbi:MAG: type I glyceraldehyde-3-phosphate dehydrogenase [Planctomycetota bacterium]
MRKIRLAINGFGRTGRTVFRDHFNRSNLEVVVINDPAAPLINAHLLKYDSTFGKFEKEIKLEKDAMFIEGKRYPFINIKEIAQIPWKDYDVDIVIESSGQFTYRAALEEHLKSGAKRALLCAPCKDTIDFTVVYGVNDKLLTKEHKMVSAASCTTNCLAPIAYVIHKTFEIEYGFINTTHAYTNDQRVLDKTHTDLRRARASAVNLIPTSTGAAKSIGLVIPELDGKLDGIAVRAPVSDGSLLDFTCLVKKQTKATEINNVFVEASKTYLKGILTVTFDPIVSSDIIGSPFSAVVDGLLTQVIDGKFVKIMAWYDNEWAYSLRILDVAERMGELLYS